MTHAVCFFTDTTGFGGAEQALLTLMAGLDRRCWEPALVYHPSPGVEGLVQGVRAQGVTLRPVPPMPEGSVGARRLLGFVRQLRAWRPAVFHAHLVWPLACKFGLAAAILARVPAIVATEHLFVDYTPPAASLWQQRLIAARVGRYLAVSHALARQLTAALPIPPGNVQVIHNGVRLAPFASPAPRPDGSGRPVVLTLARLDAQKGHRYLLEAAAAVPEAQFVLAGEGPERAALEAQAAALGLGERVCFLGYRADATALLAGCDVFVLPSLNEGLPLSILEAMAAGKPVIASAVGGLGEAIVSGESGLLVPPAAPDAVALAIRQVLADPALARRLARAGRARVERDFSASAMVGQVTGVYTELLARRGGSHAGG